MARGYGEPVLMPIIVQIDAYDPVAAAPVTLRMASDDDVAVCHLNGQIWWPVLDRLPVLAMDFFGGEFGQVTTAAASLSLAVEPWPDFARYAFADARLQIWHGNYGAVWAGYTLRFDGRVTAQPVIADGRAQIGFAVDDKWLDTPMLATYSGSGGAEGKAAMKGTPKPLAIGAPMGVPGVMLDSAKSILQLSAYGAIESVDVPLERLARQFGSPIADYATYTELDAASVPAGQWATAKAVGLVRMGAPPFGKLCFLMKGDKGGVDGWVRRPGAIIKRFAALAGGATKVSEAAVDALDLARPYDLSVYYDRQITARAAVQEIAASVNAVAGVSLTGQLIVVPIQINSTGLTLRADGSSLPIVGSVRALGISAPWWRLAIGAQPFFDVHGQGEYATETTPEAGATRNVNRGAWSGSSVDYIVGDFVQRNGSSYSVITPHTSTADNGPPGANWALLAAQGTQGDKGNKGDKGDKGDRGDQGSAGTPGIEIFDDLPTTGNYEFRTIYLRTDKKLYRYVMVNGTFRWTKAVDGADIQAASILTDAIAVGAVKAAQIDVTELSALTARIGTLRTSTVGERVELSDNGVRTFDGTGLVRVKLGNLA